MTISDDAKKNLSNPMVWIAALTILFSIVNTYNQVSTNTSYIATVKDQLTSEILVLKNRLDKKITIQDDIKSEVLTISNNLITINNELKDVQINNENIEELKDIIHSLNIEIVKLQKDLEYIDK